MLTFLNVIAGLRLPKYWENMGRYVVKVDKLRGDEDCGKRSRIFNDSESEEER